MRCKACNKLLNEMEVMKTDPSTGEHLDLCNNCLAESNKAIGSWLVDDNIPIDEETFTDAGVDTRDIW